MAGTLYIAEFQGIQAYPSNETPQVALTPQVAMQTRAMSSSASTSSAAFNGNTFIVRLYADTTCFVQFGAVGTTVATAVATSIPLPAGSPEYFGVTPGTVLAVLSSA